VRLQQGLGRIAPGTKVNANGTVKKPGFFQRILNHLTGHGAGTTLVSRLVDSKQTTSIVVNSQGVVNSRPDPATLNAHLAGQAANAIVRWDPDVTGSAPVRMPDANGNITATSPIQEQTMDSILLFAHELIHADHITRGGVAVGAVGHNYLLC
jgi:hypothetical protein